MPSFYTFIILFQPHSFFPPGVLSCTHGRSGTLATSATCTMPLPSWGTQWSPLTAKWCCTDWTEPWRTWTTSEAHMQSSACCTPRNCTWIPTTSGYVCCCVSFEVDVPYKKQTYQSLLSLAIQVWSLTTQRSYNDPNHVSVLSYSCWLTAWPLLLPHKWELRSPPMSRPHFRSSWLSSSPPSADSTTRDSTPQTKADHHLMLSVSSKTFTRRLTNKSVGKWFQVVVSVILLSSWENTKHT